MHELKTGAERPITSPVHSSLAAALRARARTASSLLGRRHFETSRQCLQKTEVLRGVRLCLKGSSQRDLARLTSSCRGQGSTGVLYAGSCPVPLLKLRQVQTSNPLLGTSRSRAGSRMSDRKDERVASACSSRRSVATPSSHYFYDDCLVVISCVKGRNTFTTNATPVSRTFNMRSQSVPPGRFHDGDDVDDSFRSTTLPELETTGQPYVKVTNVYKKGEASTAVDRHGTESLMAARVARPRTQNCARGCRGCFKALLASEAYANKHELI